ncbi:TH1 protein [Umbelopsis sp. AD052]|nr:TH1 protein [Umbelopsis sp. AD052]
MTDFQDKEKTLEQKHRALASQDSILEPNINQVLSDFLTLGGRPMDVVSCLSESYVGLPTLCNTAGEWANDLGINSQDLMRDVIKGMLLDRFDSAAVDTKFMGAETRPQWLDAMIQDPYWRKILYELSEKHQRCDLLNLAIQMIADAGYQGEIVKVATASTYIGVFNDVLKDSLERLIQEDDIGLDENLPDLVRVCCQHEQTYLYSQILLKRLADQPGGDAFRRISKALETNALTKGDDHMISTLRTYLWELPPALTSPITAILQNKHASPGDVIALYRQYTSPTPPSVRFLCDSQLLDILLKAIFVPKSGQAPKLEIQEKIIYLIAYAVTVLDTEPKNDEEIASISQKLKLLSVTLTKKSSGATMSGAIGTILELMDTPIVSMALLYWTSWLLTETSWYETYYRSAVVPVPHQILEEIAYRHPLQRPFVFQVLQNNLTVEVKNLSPEIMMALRRTLLDRMIYLVQLGYVLPVLKYIKRISSSVDESLIVHTIKMILDMAEAPYSNEFIDLIVEIIEPIAESLDKAMEVKTVVWEFLNTALNREDPINPDTREIIISLQRRF